MKSSFSIKFNTLRKDRKLSIREVALMTGVTPREVKKWEKGVSLPSDTRVMEALEGLLGEEISREFSTIEKDIVDEKVLDQSIFSLDESIFKERRNLVGRVKERILPKRIQQKNQPTDFIKTEPTEKVITDSQIDNVGSLEIEPEEDISMEYPYINDPQQIVIYWKRNIKTFLVLLVILIIGARSLSMFWVNITIFIDNLI